ncbi:MAG: hypothetical protein K6E87_04570 [bacterium]|nr:hypothetical protein [bacterium]
MVKYPTNYYIYLSTYKETRRIYYDALHELDNTIQSYSKDLLSGKDCKDYPKNISQLNIDILKYSINYIKATNRLQSLKLSKEILNG